MLNNSGRSGHPCLASDRRGNPVCLKNFIMTVSFDLKMFMWSGNESCSVLSDSLRPLGLCRLPGSSAHGILHSRILEWVAISFCRGSFQPRDWTWASCIAGCLLTIRAPYNNNMTGTSAKLRSCWVIDAGHHPGSRWCYFPHFCLWELWHTEGESAAKVPWVPPGVSLRSGLKSVRL